MQSYSQARKYARERDGCKCTCCGNKGNLTIHHIFPKCDFPQWYAEENNLITLCVKCHRRFHYEFCGNSKYKVNAYNMLKYLQKYAKSKDSIENLKFQLKELLQDEYGNHSKGFAD